MTFNSLSYFLFLPAVFLLHYFTPDRFRWLTLLAASFYFYSVLRSPHLIAVLLLITTITYFTGIWIEQKEGSRAKRCLLWGGISANVLTLAILKYLPFVTDNLNTVLSLVFPGTTNHISKTILIIGASFFIFQAISYLVDVYYEGIEAERHYGYFTLYMCFFPKLLQGPIERAGTLLPQLKREYRFDYENIRMGLLLFAWGLFKKVVVADRLALYVDSVYGDLASNAGLPLVLAVYFYSIQIYCDFSGYTDMALGTAKLFGIELTQNFNKPYTARSITEFWRRWHISFSQWLHDYIFKQLQFNLRYNGKTGLYFSIMITFIICGVWHGSTANFFLWGICHGIYMIVSAHLAPLNRQIDKIFDFAPRTLRATRILITFNLITISWILFRTETLSDAYYVVSHLHTGIYEQIKSILELGLSDKFVIAHQNNWRLSANFISILLFILFSKLYSRNNINANVFARTAIQRWSLYGLLSITFLLFGVFGRNTFIYSNF